MSFVEGKMLKFALLGNGPLSNRGCEAIVLGSIKILEREFGPSNFLLASFANDPLQSMPQNTNYLSLPYKITRWSLPWWKYRFNYLLEKPEDKSGFLKVLEHNLDNIQAGFIIGGDGYAIDYGHQIIDRLVIMGEFLREKDIPVIVWGASIGPFDKEPIFESQITKHFLGLDLIVVREPTSFEYLNKLGVLKNVIMSPDPAFVLEPKPCVLSVEIESLINNGCIGINFSPLIAKYATGNSLVDWSQLALKIIKQLLVEINMPILLIPHVTSDEYSPGMDDDLFLRDLYDSLEDSDKKSVSILPRGLSSENLKWIIGRTLLFVGARTHSTIAALSSCVPCLSIAYSRKAWGINKLIFGHQEWVYSSEKLDVDELTTKIIQLLNSRIEVQSYLLAVIPKYLEDTYSVSQKVKSVISYKLD